MELKVQSERVQEILKTHPQFEPVIHTLFPELEDYSKTFCKIGSVLIRKGLKNFYTVIVDTERNPDGMYIQIYNITHQQAWGGKLYVSKYMEAGSFVTIGMLMELLKVSGVNYKEFTVLHVEDIRHLAKPSIVLT